MKSIPILNFAFQKKQLFIFYTVVRFCTSVCICSSLQCLFSSGYAFDHIL